MNNPSSKLCPKCNKPFIEKRSINVNYAIYIHKREPGSKSLCGLIDYCIVNLDYDYDHPVNNKAIRKLHPEYRKKKIED